MRSDQPFSNLSAGESLETTTPPSLNLPPANYIKAYRISPILEPKSLPKRQS